MTSADQLTVARAASVPLVVLLFAWNFHGHAYWATVVFCLAMATDFFDGRLARRNGRTSSLGSLLDPIADKVLVLAALVMLVGLGVDPAWMVALDRRARGADHRAAAGGDRARRRPRSARPREAEDVGAGGRRRGRRFRRGRRVEQPRRVVDAPRRARPHVGVGARLRAQRARAASRPAAAQPEQ